MLRGELFDRVAHFLYRPTTGGNLAVRDRWHHHIHLIPDRLLAVACDRYDRALGVTEDELRRTAVDQ